MSHKSWTFTTYENGKPVATESNLDSRQALAAIRAAMVGEPVAPVAPVAEHRREVAEPVELAHAA